MEKGKSLSPGTTTTTVYTIADRESVSLKLGEASAMTISALGKYPICVVADADDDLARILELLGSRYASNRTGSRISVQTQLFHMRSSGQDISKFIDQYTAHFSQL